MNGVNHNMAQCEEADTRVIVHLQEGLKNGSATCLVRTGDSDVVIRLGKFFHLRNSQTADIWVAFGLGKKFTYIHTYAIAEALEKNRCEALPEFHSCTL